MKMEGTEFPYLKGHGFLDIQKWVPPDLGNGFFIFKYTRWEQAPLTGEEHAADDDSVMCDSTLGTGKTLLKSDKQARRGLANWTELKSFIHRTTA